MKGKHGVCDRNDSHARLALHPKANAKAKAQKKASRSAFRRGPRCGPCPPPCSRSLSFLLPSFTPPPAPQKSNQSPPVLPLSLRLGQHPARPPLHQLRLPLRRLDGQRVDVVLPLVRPARVLRRARLPGRGVVEGRGDAHLVLVVLKGSVGWLVWGMEGWMGRWGLARQGLELGRATHTHTNIHPPTSTHTALTD